MTAQDSAEEAVRSFAAQPGSPDVWLFRRADPLFEALGVRGPNSQGERDRAALIQDEREQVHLLARRAAVRRVLGLYLGREPEAVQIVTLPGGKPAFVPEATDRLRLSFSSGHSGGLFTLAVATAASLGVDIERDRPVSRARSIARRWFTGHEADTLETTPEERLNEEFLRMWTAKEALAKRHSAGLRLMTSRAGVELDVYGEVAAGRLSYFDAGASHFAALASTSPIHAVRVVMPKDALP